jgi:hypothetical protein
VRESKVINVLEDTYSGEQFYKPFYKIKVYELFFWLIK